jgi:hypothetical protein
MTRKRSGRNTAVVIHSLTLSLYSATPIAMAKARYNSDETATPEPKETPSMLALNVWAVISVKAIITYTRASQTNTRKNL